MAARGKQRRRQQPEGPFETEVADLSQDARGVARVDGKVVFIRDALAGERVRYMRHRSRSSFDEGQLHSLLRAAPERVEPGCEHFGLCGGCSLQHLAPAAQIRFKQAQLLGNLQRIGRVEPEEIAEPLAGPVWAYRRRARLTVKDVPAKGRVLVGFRERDKPFVADLKRCEILQAPVNELLLPLGELIGQLSLRNRLPQIEVAVADNATALVLRVLDAPTAADRQLLESFARRHGVCFFLQTGGLDTVTPLLSGTPELAFSIDDGLVLHFSPTDFLQINTQINQAMVRQAMDWLAPGTDDHVLELFCGLGNFSLPLARRCRQVTAVEGEAGLIRQARANAVANQLGNLNFHVADLFENQAEADWLRQPLDLALIDPPRAGAEAACGWLAAAGVRRILYVSCHPATLARDAGLLVHEHGYRLRRAGVMDMFPHTQHIESMTLFERND